VNQKILNFWDFGHFMLDGFLSHFWAMGTRLAPLAAVAASPIFKLTMMESAVVARSTTTVTAASAANLWPFNSNPQLHHSHRYSENPELSAAQ